jgi:hypothetical protein
MSAQDVLFPLAPKLAREPGTPEPAISTTAMFLSTAGTVLGAYHGYRRNDSIGWGILGGMFPIFVLPIAAAQGFAKPSR